MLLRQSKTYRMGCTGLQWQKACRSRCIHSLIADEALTRVERVDFGSIQHSVDACNQLLLKKSWVSSLGCHQAAQPHLQKSHDFEPRLALWLAAEANSRKERLKSRPTDNATLTHPDLQLLGVDFQRWVDTEPDNIPPAPRHDLHRNGTGYQHLTACTKIWQTCASSP